MTAQELAEILMQVPGDLEVEIDGSIIYSVKVCHGLFFKEVGIYISINSEKEEEKYKEINNVVAVLYKDDE